MSLQRDTFAVQRDDGWEDSLGYVGPYKPGDGPRTNPMDEFPTGPEVGTRLPDIVAPDHGGTIVDVHRERGSRPAVMVFFRSAVW